MKKEDFVSYIEQIKNASDFTDELNRLFEKYDNYGSILLPKSVSLCVDILVTTLNDNDDWISYYCWEMNFGRDWKPGMITSKDGNDIPLNTPEDLWEMLFEVSDD